MEKLRQCRNNYRKGGCFDGKKHSEKEKTSLDSPSPKLNKSMIAYHETGDLFADTCEIVESAQSIAYAAVDTILVQRNWLLGKRIAIECLNENGKADYGKKTMKKLSSELKEKYGKGFDFSSLYKYVKFHQEFPQILDSLRPKSVRPLSWTHYRILLQETHQRHEYGMQKRHRSKHGPFGLCNGIFLHSIITACSCLKIQNL